MPIADFELESHRRDKVNPLVLLVKVAYFGHQSQPRAKVKQLVLLYRKADRHQQNSASAAERWKIGKTKRTVPVVS